MRRLFFAAIPLALVLGSACGDGNGAGNDDADATSEATATLDVNVQPQSPDREIATPTPIPDDQPLVQVVVAGKPYLPTRADLAALPKAKITAGGNSYEGVSLATLAEKAGAPAGATATIQGTRMDNLRLGAIRFPLPDIGASTVFVIDDKGHLLLASTTVPHDQWLKDITGISLN